MEAELPFMTSLKSLIASFLLHAIQQSSVSFRRACGNRNIVAVFGKEFNTTVVPSGEF